ncbi:FMN-binding negative transcriptional regulator [Gallionella capsiferriformans]|jgi:transcriptional regulator|uniref:FMN-binding negative transcriptional regulator n=1 Tax=Gallionella capsiferriformans (strain ES-2) TaxID=395494 RepID=D9SG85_GALCS|nr:FMN-binding negative transcriptional regulator [Gallionella capsiferriformans]ADL55532.1 FMN-binding negative transcriptional regulator [Gallionella capsiferriformans ES-2]
MYIPKQFEETDVDVLHELIRIKPLATLVTLNAGGIDANHIPLILSAETKPYGTLSGHVARSNPLWQNHPADTDVLVIFHGAESYITPSWYASKAESGKVVPTWNYVSVQAKGRLRVIHEPDWILSQLESLTAHNEAGFEHPWAVADAPHEFTRKLLDVIVGIEIEITELKGKWKVSQNRSDQDRASVVSGLTNTGQPEMAALVKRCAKDGAI